MKAILKIFNRLAATLKKPFRKTRPAPAIDAHAEMLKIVTRAESAIYKSIKIQLQNDPYLPLYGADVRLLHRRLAQYELMRTHASLADQEKALHVLEKQWKKVESRRKHL